MTDPDSFVGTLTQQPGQSWVFVEIPPEYAPGAAGAWGRTPVVAQINHHSVRTSAWRTKDGRWWLPVSKDIRGRLDCGDEVVVAIRPDPERSA